MEKRFSSFVFIILSLLFFAACFISGCASKEGQAAGGAAGGAVVGSQVMPIAAGASTPVGAGIGATIGGTVNYFRFTDSCIIKRLQSRHVQVVRMGHEIKFILHTDRYFYVGTPRLKSVSSPDLNDVARLLKSNKTSPVIITGFTDDVFADHAQLAHLQAEQILAYFWKCGDRLEPSESAQM